MDKLKVDGNESVKRESPEVSFISFLKSISIPCFYSAYNSTHEMTEENKYY